MRRIVQVNFFVFVQGRLHGLFRTFAVCRIIQAKIELTRSIAVFIDVCVAETEKIVVVRNGRIDRKIFENGEIFFAPLAHASQVIVQKDKTGIEDDAVSAVTAKAVIYMPFAELVDVEKEIERLKKEEEKLTKELARVNGMLGNERFISKAPKAKVDEERAKLERYTAMMEQVKERLAQLQ